MSDFTGSTPGEPGGWESPMVEERRRARWHRLTWPMMFVGLIVMCAGVIPATLAVVWLASDAGTRWHGPALIGAIMIPGGLALWVGGSHLAGAGSGWDILLMMLELGAAKPLKRAGLFVAAVGAVSAVGGGPLGVALPILAGGIAAIALGYALQRVGLRAIEEPRS